VPKALCDEHRGAARRVQSVDRVRAERGRADPDVDHDVEDGTAHAVDELRLSGGSRTLWMPRSVPGREMEKFDWSGVNACPVASAMVSQRSDS